MGPSEALSQYNGLWCESRTKKEELTVLVTKAPRERPRKAKSGGLGEG